MHRITTFFLSCFLLIASFHCNAVEAWVAGWQPASSLTTARAGAAVIEAKGVIYVIGGIDGINFLASTEYSTIQPDGSLSAWRTSSPLNEPRGFFAAVEHNGFIYAAGGGNGPNGKHLLNSVERAQILPDHSLGPWHSERNTLSYPRRCVKLVVAGDYIYALGGFAGALLDSVERAQILADGSIGPWSLEKKAMTMPRYVHTAKKLGKSVFVIGGHNEAEGNGLREVEIGKLDTANNITGWEKTSALQHGRYALSAAANNNYLYALGGLDGAIYSAVIEKSNRETDGLSPWQETTPLSSPRANFGVVTYGQRIYIIGGTNRDGYYATVESAGFSAGGDIGFWASPQQAALHQQQLKIREHAARPKLPNEGVISEIIHTEAYSYIEVVNAGERRWLAAPRSDFVVNDKVRYSRGLTMNNFHSKALQRDFAAILFVERIEKVIDNQ